MIRYNIFRKQTNDSAKGKQINKYLIICIYIYIYTHLSLSIYIYIYIYPMAAILSFERPESFLSYTFVLSYGVMFDYLIPSC